MKKKVRRHSQRHHHHPIAKAAMDTWIGKATSMLSWRIFALSKPNINMDTSRNTKIKIHVSNFS